MTVCQLLFFSLLTIACGSAPSQHQNTTAYSSPKPLLNILDIANQTQEDIATILGPQSSLSLAAAARSGCPTCQKYSYQDGKIEIVYINDMADWITIFPPPGTPARQTPTLLGLPYTQPDDSDPTIMRWKNRAGIREIQAHLTEAGTIDFIYLVVNTP